MTSDERRAFLIRRVTDDRVPEVLAFHRANGSEHLWPRDQEYLAERVADEALFALVEADRVVGMCYFAWDPDQRRFEFGGVCLDGSCRSKGLGDHLAKAALASVFVLENGDAKFEVIAHVHEKNPLPRRMLERVGFCWDGHRSEVPPKGIAPASMAQNADGRVVGHVYSFDACRCADIAQWLESLPFDGDNFSLVVDLPIATIDRAEALTALRDPAMQAPAGPRRT
jgi:ribosomal protein S18 acetylase RimI-like enzyme